MFFAPCPIQFGTEPNCLASAGKMNCPISGSETGIDTYSKMLESFRFEKEKNNESSKESRKMDKIKRISRFYCI
jgi:hypothetical protein